MRVEMYFSDLDTEQSTPLRDDQVVHTKLALDDESVVLEITAEEHKELRKLLKSYFKAGSNTKAPEKKITVQEVKISRSSPESKYSKEERQEIRAFAISKGLIKQSKKSGRWPTRLPKSVFEAWEDAQ